MSRTKKANPGRILFVGSGPGDPDLLTVRARTVIANATTAFIDPDVPAAVVAMIGSAHRQELAESARKSTKNDTKKADQATDETESDDTSSPTEDIVDSIPDSARDPLSAAPAPEPASPEVRRAWEELAAEIRDHSAKYYTGQPVISDAEYDERAGRGARTLTVTRATATAGAVSACTFDA